MPEPIELSTQKIKVEHVDFKGKNDVRLNEKSPDLENRGFYENGVCKNPDVTSQSLAESAIKYNAGNAMNPRFLKLIPSDETMWLLKNKPNSFLLLTQISERARREDGHPDGLKPGECYLGDCQNCGLTEQEYRTAKTILEKRSHIKIIETCRNRKKSTTGVTTRGTKVKLISSNVYDININIVNDRINDRPTTDQRPTNDDQEGIKKDKKEKEVHHPNPSSEKKMIDDSLQKEKIHVCLDVYMDQEDLDECIKIKGSLENVKDFIEKIQKSPGKNKNIQISNWARTLNVWKLSNSVADKNIENENIAKKFIEEHEENAGCQFRIYHDRAKDVRGILFQGLGATSTSILIAFSDSEFKTKLSKEKKDRKIKKKGEK